MLRRRVGGLCGWGNLENSKTLNVVFRCIYICIHLLPTQPCTKDEECCSDEMCVWGQCTANVTRGTEGTICQGQSDCRPDLCCAFQPGTVKKKTAIKYSESLFTIYCESGIIHYILSLSLTSSHSYLVICAF